MSNIDKQALREEFQYMQDHYNDPADRARQVIYIAAEALLDEVEAAEHTAAVDHEAACSLVEENEELKRRIAELESKNGNLRTIAQEQNELAIRANLDSNNDAVEMNRLHKRIAELEAREVMLPAEKFCPSEYAGSQYWEETEVWNKAISACAVAIRAAGIKVKGE